jgi:peptidoglycan/LPS O-acetylase OafA/YrhL
MGRPIYQDWFRITCFFFLGFIRVTYPFWAGVLMFRVLRLQSAPSVPMTLVGLTLALLLLAPIDEPAYNLLLVLIVFPAIVALTARTSVGRRTAYSCSFLGRLSCPLYLVHVPGFEAIKSASKVLHFGVTPWALDIVGSVVSVIVAEALLVAFDEPVRAWLSSQMRGGLNPHAAAQRG